MLPDKDVISLKREFGKKKLVNKKKEVVFEENEKTKILELTDNDSSLKYYLLGQLISYIDFLKWQSDKNNDTFSNFINNVNRNNIRKLFATEILQKNNFYINKFSKKGRFIFSILESDLDSLFDEEDGFTYEDYVLLLFTGYYAENILKNNYEFME